LTGARASALEVENVGGKPLVIDITNTAVVAWNFNNRNDSDLNPPTQVDDNYGNFLDRLNVQASWWRLRLGFRLDTALFFATMNRQGIAGLVKDQTPYVNASATPTNPATAVAADATNNLVAELHSRFLRSIYPSKLFVGYEQKGLDVTVGDFYVQLGRGLVFSVRKIDELAIDTTVRGVKAAADAKAGEVQFDTMLFAGQMNPLRTDEASGRRLNGAGSPLFFGFPGAGPMEQYDVRSVPGKVLQQILPGQPSYYEDTVAGGKVEASTRLFSLGADAVGLYRKHAAFSSTDPSKEHDRILNWSGTLNVPSILKHGDLYVEVAGQAMRDGHLAANGQAQPNLDGYAAYVSASVTGGPVSFSLEGKHYRNFFPLSANVDITSPGFSAPEFSLVTYSQPPTAEPIYSEVVSGGSPNVCNTGGRARLDYRYDRETSLYAWAGRYTSWSEVPGQDLSHGCTIAASVTDPMTMKVRAVQTDIWDAATGLDLGFQKGATHIKAWVGVRTSDTAVPELTQGEAEPITAFYREGYLRYDMVFHLKGPFSLQFQGFHRHRWEPVGFVKPWNEGENYTALQWSPHLSAVFGYEYLAKDGCQPFRTQTLSAPARSQSNFCNYVSGGLQWRSGTTWADNPRKKYVAQLFDAVNLFVGQRRGAIRCVNGSCRQFQPFEGARLEITSRF
jgi:hypothetical protein